MNHTVKTPILIFLMLLTLSVFFSGCTHSDQSEDTRSETREFFAMDTYMRLTATGDEATAAVLEGQALIEELDKKLSTNGDGQSEISNLNSRAGEKVPLSEDTLNLIERSLILCERTKGTFDITLLPVKNLWGIGTESAKIPAKEELREALDKVGYTHVAFEGTSVTCNAGAQIDLGAVGKGYAADRVVELFREKGIESGLITLSGNIYAYGCKPDGSMWRVGIQDPKGADGAYLAVVLAEDISIVTSGDYERVSHLEGKDYHHIFDPATGYPVENDLCSVTVISKDSAMADAYSTALFVMGLEDALAFWESQQNTKESFEAVLITKDNEVICTKGIKDIFEVTNQDDYEYVFL